MGTALRHADHLQKRSRLGVLVATAGKFRDDRSQHLAAMLAFWAFFSVFPLFLLLVSLLGYFLPASTKAHVLHHVAALFPLLDPSTVGQLGGTAWAALLGGLTALWSGTSVMRGAEHAFDVVWGLPTAQRPKLGVQLKRAVAALSTIGVGLVLSTIVSGFVTGNDTGVNLGAGGDVGGYLLAAALDVGLFVAAFRLLTARRVTVRDVLPGALLSGAVFWILQQLASFIIARHLHGTQSTYGHFATVITILWWFYLQALVTMLGAQLNVVVKNGPGPRRAADTAGTDTAGTDAESSTPAGRSRPRDRAADENGAADADTARVGERSR